MYKEKAVPVAILFRLGRSNDSRPTHSEFIVSISVGCMRGYRTRGF